MGWWLTQATNPVVIPPSQTVPTDHSLTTALIAALSAVLVALITIGLPLLLKSRTVEPPPPTGDPRLGETVAVVASKQDDDRRTLAQLDRHVDGQGEEIDKLRWDVDDLKAWRDEHRRQHGEP